MTASGLQNSEAGSADSSEATAARYWRARSALEVVREGSLPSEITQLWLCNQEK
jgi:hypothetical protein